MLSALNRFNSFPSNIYHKLKIDLFKNLILYKELNILLKYSNYSTEYFLYFTDVTNTMISVLNWISSYIKFE
jgi:hypothetical protein